MEEMIDFLSPTMECPLVQSEEHIGTGETTSKTNLPAIDLLLNPARATELSQMQRWVEERAENITLTEVVPILRVCTQIRLTDSLDFADSNP